MTYTFTHSVECAAGREFAWAFWSEVGNWAAVDPAVESVNRESRLEGDSVEFDEDSVEEERAGRPHFRVGGAGLIKGRAFC